VNASDDPWTFSGFESHHAYPYDQLINQYRTPLMMETAIFEQFSCGQPSREYRVGYRTSPVNTGTAHSLDISSTQASAEMSRDQSELYPRTNSFAQLPQTQDILWNIAPMGHGKLHVARIAASHFDSPMATQSQPTPPEDPHRSSVKTSQCDECSEVFPRRCDLK
jgi:hypothetical protein